MKKVFFLFLFFLVRFCRADYDSRIWILYLKGNYKELEETLGTEPYARDPELLFLQAQTVLRGGKFELARYLFDKLLNYGGKWSLYGLIGLGDSYFLETKFENAKSIYETCLKKYRNFEGKALVIYKLALLERKLGHWQKAQQYLNNLVRKYPDSIIASSARKILNENLFYFTIQVGAFNNYDNAYKLMQRLKKLGFDAEIRKAKLKGRLYYRVWVGKFDEPHSARKELRKLIMHGFNPYIYP